MFSELFSSPFLPLAPNPFNWLPLPPHPPPPLGTTGGSGLAAIKLTALGRPQLLINLSQVLIQNKRYYEEQNKKLKKTDEVFHELTDKSIKRKQVCGTVRATWGVCVSCASCAFPRRRNTPTTSISYLGESDS